MHISGTRQGPRAPYPYLGLGLWSMVHGYPVSQNCTLKLPPSTRTPFPLVFHPPVKLHTYRGIGREGPPPPRTHPQGGGKGGGRQTFRTGRSQPCSPPGNV